MLKLGADPANAIRCYYVDNEKEPIKQNLSNYFLVKIKDQFKY